MAAKGKRKYRFFIAELEKNFTRMTENIGSGFTNIAKKSRGLDEANTNIQDVWLEIGNSDVFASYRREQRAYFVRTRNTGIAGTD